MAETQDSNCPNGTWRCANMPHTVEPVPRDAVDLDVSWILAPDLSTIDVLTRLHVVACRCDRSLWLHGATTELIELLDLVGLREIVHLCPCGTLNEKRLDHAPRS